MPTDRLTIEVSVEFPDLKPEDVDLLGEVIDDLDERFHMGTDLADRLEDLRQRIARMLVTACEGMR